MIEAESELLRAAGVVHGFGGRQGGVSTGVYATANAGFGSGDARAAVAENRRRFAAALGTAADRLCVPRQVHGTVVEVIDRAPGDPIVADGLASRTPGLLLAVTTADCVPVLIVDPEARAAAAVHAGWRGAVAGVVPAALDALRRLGAEPGRCHAAIGPCIRQQSYEVDAPVRDAALAGRPERHHLFRAQAVPGRWRFDLPGLVRHELYGCGVKQVDDLGVDTLDKGIRYFSFRRSRQAGEPAYGVQLSGVVVPA
jgi:YfiH family protein